MNEKALSAYIIECHVAEENLQKLIAYVDNYGDANPEKVNWNHVGSMTRVNSLIDEVLVAVGLKEDSDG